MASLAISALCVVIAIRGLRNMAKAERRSRDHHNKVVAISKRFDEAP